LVQRSKVCQGRVRTGVAGAGRVAAASANSIDVHTRPQARVPLARLAKVLAPIEAPPGPFRPPRAERIRGQRRLDRLWGRVHTPSDRDEPGIPCRVRTNS
jgi:hypothetical protein